MSGLSKKRQREDEMRGEITDLSTENALLKVEIAKLKSANTNLQESEAKEKVSKLESNKKDLLAVIRSHSQGQKTKGEVQKGGSLGLEKEKDDTAPVFHFAVPETVIEEHNKDDDEARKVDSSKFLNLTAKYDDMPEGKHQKMDTSETEVDIQDGVIIHYNDEEDDITGLREELKKYKKVVEELQTLVECPVCLNTPKQGPMPCCPAGHLTCAPCLDAMRKKGKKMCPSCRGPLGKGKSLLSSAIIKTVEEKDSEQDQRDPQPGGSKMPGTSNGKFASGIKGRILTQGKLSPRGSKGSPVSAKKKVTFGISPGGSRSGALARFEGTCPLCGKKFLDAMELETHASECEGEDQVTGVLIL